MIDLILAGLAAVAAGFVNAIAGGGSLITFPALVALGLPSVAASATNTIALCPGYFGGAWAQRRDLAGQRARTLRLLPVTAIGGIAGALLLLATGDAAFDVIVPFLILGAALLLAAQDRIKRALAKRAHGGDAFGAAVIPVALASVYGGYFGAGSGIMILAALAIVVDDTLVRLNAFKQVCSTALNITAAVVLALSPQTRWAFVPPMAIGALVGGMLGGALASRIPARVLRWTIVVLGVVLAGYYFVRRFGHL